MAVVYENNVSISVNAMTFTHKNQNQAVQTIMTFVGEKCFQIKIKGLKAAYSVTMNIFRKKYFLFKSFAKVE